MSEIRKIQFERSDFGHFGTIYSINAEIRTFERSKSEHGYLERLIVRLSVSSEIQTLGFRTLTVHILKLKNPIRIIHRNPHHSNKIYLNRAGFYQKVQ